MKKQKPETLFVSLKLTGKALDIVWSEKERYEKQKRIISKSEIVNKLLAATDADKKAK